MVTTSTRLHIPSQPSRIAMLKRNQIFIYGIILVAVSLLPQKVGAQISIRTGLADDRIIETGTSYEGTISVVNETDEIQRVNVYQNDYLFYSDGTNLYGTPGNDPRSNADWIVVSVSSISIPPRQNIDIAYLVTVPESTSSFPLSGSYWSMIMVEAVPYASANDLEQRRQLGVRQKLRYGIQIASHIKNTGQSQLEIKNSALSQGENGDTALVIHVENTGDVMLRPQMWVELYDLKGNTLGRFDGAQNRIYPTTSVMQKIHLGLVEPGKYRAIIIMDAGDDEIFGTEVAIEILESADR